MLKVLVLSAVVSLLSSGHVSAAQRKVSRTAERPEFESKVHSEINNVRQKPWKYAPNVAVYQDLLRGDVLYLKDRQPFLLNEGAKVLEIARENLLKRGITKPLTRSGTLDTVARSHLNDLLDNPQLGHRGKDGANLSKRILRHAAISGPVGENITYSDVTPRQAVLSMLIDDGVETRQHRENILNPDFALIGIACGITTQDKPICVIEFATTLLPKGFEEF